MRRRSASALGAAVVLLLGCESTTGVEVTATREFGDHLEIDVSFQSDGATLQGTLHLAPGEGPKRAIVFNGGSSWTLREPWSSVGPLASLVGSVFTYDKRGHGASGGTCCPADDAAAFDQLAIDWVAAVRAVRTLSQVDPERVGIFGSSYSGWTLPRAAALGGSDIAFGIVAVGGAVSVGQEQLYDDLTGYSSCTPTGRSDASVTDSLIAVGPSGFDPMSSLEALSQPTLWIYGGRDLSHPTTLSVMNLAAIQGNGARPWTVAVFPNANHDLIENGAICQTEGELTPGLVPTMEQFLNGL